MRPPPGKEKKRLSKHSEMVNSGRRQETCLLLVDSTECPVISREPESEFLFLKRKLFASAARVKVSSNLENSLNTSGKIAKLNQKGKVDLDGSSGTSWH